MIDEMYRNKFGYFHFQKPPNQKYHRVNMEQFSQKKRKFYNIYIFTNNNSSAFKILCDATT